MPPVSFEEEKRVAKGFFQSEDQVVIAVAERAVNVEENGLDAADVQAHHILANCPLPVLWL